MGHWNHRVFRTTHFNYGEFYSIRETYYDDNGEVDKYDSEPVKLEGESVEDLRQYLQWCIDALDKPILEDE